MSDRLYLHPLLRYLYCYPMFWGGYAAFRVSGRTPPASYRCMRRLYTASCGRFNERVSDWLARGAEPVAVERRTGLIGAAKGRSASVAAALADLDRNGFHRFEQRLDGDAVARLSALARGAECRLVPPRSGAPVTSRFDASAARAPRYQLDEAEVVADETVQEFVTDEALLEIAQCYLGVAPINDLVAMWWSAPAEPESRSGAAQLFHFDMDRLRFLKFFVYLTNVGPENGPHVVVRGSHRRRPAAFYEDRRFSDAEVAAAFPSEDVLELEGPAGTVLAVDTSALHKGKALTSGHRLILQLEYTNSLFGQTYSTPAPRLRNDSPLAAAISRHPRVFRRFAAVRETA